MALSEFEEKVLLELGEIKRKMAEDLGELKGRMSAIEARKEICNIHQAETKLLRKELDGNGQPGLKRKVDILFTDLKVFKTKVAAWSAAGSFIGGGILFIVTNVDKIEYLVKLIRGR